MRNMMRNLMLGTALAAGLFGASAISANAAPLQFQVGVAGYVPPCPGEGYVWVAGYYNGGYLVPGAWVFRGHRDWDRSYYYGRGYGYGYGYDRDRHFDRDWDRDRDRRDWDRDRDRGRGWDRDRHFDRDDRDRR